MPIDPSAPVIIACAQQTWFEPDTARTPVAALQEVASAALASADCAGLSDSIDTVATVRFIMDTDPNLAALLPRNPGAQVAQHLGIKGATCYQTTIGGNTPQLLVNHFAARLAAGKDKAVLLMGAEFLNTFFDALRNGHDISHWRGEDNGSPMMIGEEKEGLNAEEASHGLYEPINTYPLFENALRHAKGNDRESQDQSTAALCQQMAAVAAGNQYAWRRDQPDAQGIGTVSERNRYISYPYTKAMNALLSVDMGAALVMTTAGHAAQLGIPEQQWIYLRGGADVNEIWHFSEREALHRAPAIGIASRALLAQSGLLLEDIDHFDLYSCFPSAVEIACNEIGLAPTDPRGVTVTGGLPFFGGPGNNYSLHAIAEMVARLRRNPGHGLVTANGLYLTKHSLGLYSSEPGPAPWQPLDGSKLQSEVDAAPRRQLAAEPNGPAIIEAFTVAFDRQGPSRGFIVAKNLAGERIIANVAKDSPSLATLLEEDVVGRQGKVKRTGGINLFEF